jgi:hypothetical protein
MLRRDVAPVLPIMQKLLEGGISMHTQVVVCPEWNDGAELERTIDELYVLGDGILSLALVPVGLTGHRSRLSQLRVPTAAEARSVVEMLPELQNRCLHERGTRWLFAADEWFLRCGHEFPAYGNYEDFPQLENGVGLIADFRHRARLVLSHVRSQCQVRATTITGRSFAGELARFLEKLEAVSEALRSVHADARIVVVFQPHLFSRTRDFAGEFAAALDAADEARVLPIYPSRESPLEGVTSDLILARGRASRAIDPPAAVELAFAARSAGTPTVVAVQRGFWRRPRARGGGGVAVAPSSGQACLG